MKNQPQIAGGKLLDHSRGLGTVTPELVAQRAREIALINGRPSEKANESDFAQAKRELMGVETPDSASTETTAIAATKAWDPVPGSMGRQIDNQNTDDEQAVAQKLVEEGIVEAEHERMVEATKESLRKDQS
jgi:hypothetical protein